MDGSVGLRERIRRLVGTTVVAVGLLRALAAAAHATGLYSVIRKTLFPVLSAALTVKLREPVVEVSIGLPEATGPAHLATSVGPSGSSRGDRATQ